jgi:tetratricopeptide (TPR) repeat protein
VDSSPTIDPASFVAAITPALERRDVQSVLDICKERWSADDVVSLLTCDNRDARKVAALALSLAGCQKCLEPLARTLRDRDPMVNEMAEHAMWAIWFRGGATQEANHQLARGAMAMERKDIPHAIEHFDRAIRFDPAFSEAYNQRAIAKFMLERFDDSLADCRRVICLNPDHFGAWAGMGHCHAHQRHFAEAIACYEKALSVNPHMHQLREVIADLHNGCCEKQR